MVIARAERRVPAQKIDPATHTYSHTKLVASFAGFAPVSNPAISVAVVIDTPTAGSEVQHYGGAASAPVFAEVAQQVLEYLGVPHDQPLKTKKELTVAAKTDEADDAPSENTPDLTAMFDDVNSLPADDPLRAPANAAASSADVATNQRPVAVTQKATQNTAGIMNLLPAKVLAAFQTNGGASLGTSGDGAASMRLTPAKTVPAVEVKEKGAVVVDAGLRVPVPSFEGTGVEGRGGAGGCRGSAGAGGGKWIGSRAGTCGGDDGACGDRGDCAVQQIELLWRQVPFLSASILI